MDGGSFFETVVDSAFSYIELEGFGFRTKTLQFPGRPPLRYPFERYPVSDNVTSESADNYFYTLPVPLSIKGNPQATDK